MNKILIRRERGQIGWAGLVLILLLCAGGWNYLRSYQADQGNPRSLPFSNYSTPDLIALQAAYTETLESSRAAYAAKRGGGQPGPSPAPSGLADRVRNLEHAQAEAGALRNARADVAQAEVRVGEIEAEIKRRTQLLSGLRVHLERVFRRSGLTAEDP